MPVRYRRARPEDIPKARRFLESERPLLSPPIWNLLPRLLEDLLKRERIVLCVIEEQETGRFRLLGASGFLAPDFLQSALGHHDKTLLELALAAESRQRSVFLGHKQIAQANRCSDLRLLDFLGVPVDMDLTDPGEDLTLGCTTEAWNFFHRGYQFRELWHESAHPLMQQLLSSIGMHVFREHLDTSGQPVKLFHFSREDALKNPPTWPASAMLSPHPRLGFTWAEQKLLELVLLDYSDRDAADHLDLSLDAVKKRWRSIYAKVSTADPALLGSDVTGADRRRILLQRLRHNLEELRPY